MHLRFLTVLFCSLFVFAANAQIPVRIEKPVKLFSQPSERSLVLTEIGGRANFRALEQSPNKQWVFVSDGLRYGWVRKVFVKPIDEVVSVLTEAPVKKARPKEVIVAEDAAPDPDLPAEDDVIEGKKSKTEEDFEDDVDIDATKKSDETEIYLVKLPGSFYEEPKKNTQKFGKLEPNDEIEVLQNSQDGKWSKIRLTETGEEGWYPRSRIGRKVPSSELRNMESIATGKRNHFGVHGVGAPAPWGVGAQAFFRHGFSSLAIGTTPLELGFGGGFNAGSVEETDFGSDIKVSYIDMRLFAHLEPLLSSRWSLPIQVGLLYKYGIIETELAVEDFESLNSRIMENEFGAYVGIGLGYYLFDSLSIELMPQVQLTSSVDFVFNGGLVINF